jgi:hypothetical protein
MPDNPYLVFGPDHQATWKDDLGNEIHAAVQGRPDLVQRYTAEARISLELRNLPAASAGSALLDPVTQPGPIFSTFEVYANPAVETAGLRALEDDAAPDAQKFDVLVSFSIVRQVGPPPGSKSEIALVLNIDPSIGPGEVHLYDLVEYKTAAAWTETDVVALNLYEDETRGSGHWHSRSAGGARTDGNAGVEVPRTPEAFSGSWRLRVEGQSNAASYTLSGTFLESDRLRP